MIKLNLVTSVYQGTEFKGATRNIIYLKEPTIDDIEKIRCGNNIFIVNEYFIDQKEALKRHMELYKDFKNMPSVKKLEGH